MHFIKFYLLKSISIIFLVGWTYSASGQDKTKLVTQRREVAGFTKITIEGNLQVYIKQGTKYKLKVEANEELVKNIKTTVQENMLQIYTEKMPWSLQNKIVRVYIVTPKLEYLAAKGLSDIWMENEFKSPHFTLIAERASNIEASIDSKLVKCIVKNSADVNISGFADTFQVNVQNSGDLKAYKLKAGVCNVEVSGSGNVDLFVTKEMAAHVSESADLEYKGNPIVKKMTIKDSADASKR